MKGSWEDSYGGGADGGDDFGDAPQRRCCRDMRSRISLSVRSGLERGGLPGDYAELAFFV